MALMNLLRDIPNKVVQMMMDKGYARVLSDEERIKMAEDVISSIIKVDPAPWFRSPFGAGADDLRLQEALAATGYRQVLWNASGDDWDHRKTVQQVEDDMVNTAVAHGDGAILLCHTWPSYTHEGLAGAVRRLREAGATFVTIDQLDQELVPGIPGLPKR